MPPARWAGGAAALKIAVLRRSAWTGWAPGQGCSLRCLLLLFRFGRRAGGPGRGCRQPFQRAPRGILFRVLFGVPHPAGQRLSRPSLVRLEPDLDQKSLAVVGTAFTPD